MALTDPKTLCEPIYAFAFAVKGALRDERQGAGDSVGCATPGSKLRCSFRTTAQARAVTRFLSSRGRSIKSTVFKFRSAGGADRATINASGLNANVDKAIEARVAALQSTVACIFVGQLHKQSFS